MNALIVLTAGSFAAHVSARPGWARAQRFISGTVLAGLALRVVTDRSRAAVPA